MRAKRKPRPSLNLMPKPVNDYEIEHDGKTYAVRYIRNGHFGCEVDGEVFKGSIKTIKDVIMERSNRTATIETENPVDVLKSRPTWLSLSPATLLAQLWLRKAVPGDMLDTVHECLDCAGLVGPDSEVDRQAVEDAYELYERVKRLATPEPSGEENVE